MPGKLKIKVFAARDLPVMDRASDLADAFVEVRFGQTTHKTDVFRKSLNPQWDTDWYKFEVDDEELQDEPLQIRVLDYDTYSAHDTIGKVYIDLNPLLWKDGVSEISGWMPIFDTMHGIRGEINVVVKVDLIEDANKFRDSSCGVEFFTSTRFPTCYTLESIHGFVEELVVNDDPEYQWLDMIRTPRASNEVRQRLFSKLSGELQRKIGLKVLDLQGNAVIGYNQRFDLEGESGVVVRGIGTVVTLQKAAPSAAASPSQEGLQPLEEFVEDVGQRLPVQVPPPSPTKTGPFQYSSNTDLSSTPQGLLASSGGSGGLSRQVTQPLKLRAINIDRMEFPFFTITNFPSGFLVKLGGVVTARSIKLLDRIHNPDEPETRDAWWIEIRTEIRSHAVAMGCHAVVGYKETTSICDEICLLSATGTAAIVNLNLTQDSSLSSSLSMDKQDFLREQQAATPPPLTTEVQDAQAVDVSSKCLLCHIPYNDAALPFSVSLTKCNICRRQKVPDVLFSTIEPPDGLHFTGKGCCIQARVCKGKRRAQGEFNAAIISDALPFVEFELHRQLMNKLKVKGMNALFGLRVVITVGENVLIGTATASAVYVTALPSPSAVKISYKSTKAEDKLQEEKLQQKLTDLRARNKELFELHPQESPVDLDTSAMGSVEDVNDPQLNAGFKETFIIEVDETEDSQYIAELFESNLPKGFHSCSTDVLPGNVQLSQHLQTATVMRRQSLIEPGNRNLTTTFNEMIQSLCFKLRGHTPCCLCKLSWDISLSEDDMAYIWLTAAALKVKVNVDASNDAISSEGDMMFPIEGISEPSATQNKRSVRDTRSRLERRIYIRDPFWSPSVQITPLNNLLNGTIDQYLGYINIFFIRECTSVRESGGVGGFMHGFISEVHAIVRAHVEALGGNALVGYTLVDFVLMDNPNKNQCQGLINVSGDAVHVQYDGAPSADLSVTEGESAGNRTPIADRLPRAS